MTPRELEINVLLATHLFDLDAQQREVVGRWEMQGCDNRKVFCYYGLDRCSEALPWERRRRVWTIPGGPGDYCEIPNWLTWVGTGEVIEAMRAKDFRVALRAWPDTVRGEPIGDTFCAAFKRGQEGIEPVRGGAANADAGPLAVGMAALRALGLEAPS